MSDKNLENVEDILKSKNDPNGQYTGNPRFDEKPEVDVDDL